MLQTLPTFLHTLFLFLTASNWALQSLKRHKENSREKILLLLKTHPQYSAKKLADAIGITEKGVEKQLAKLKAEGLLKRTGPDKGGEWIVLE